MLNRWMDGHVRATTVKIVLVFLLTSILYWCWLSNIYSLTSILKQLKHFIIRTNNEDASGMAAMLNVACGLAHFFAVWLT